MSTTNPNIVIKNITCLTGRNVEPTTEKTYKMCLVEKSINHSKYTVIGMVDRTNNVILQTRFHNVRDNKGRFARVARNRRSR